MYLLNSFTTVLDNSNILSDIAGYTHRLKFFEISKEKKKKKGGGILITSPSLRICELLEKLEKIKNNVASDNDSTDESSEDIDDADSTSGINRDDFDVSAPRFCMHV